MKPMPSKVLIDGVISASDKVNPAIHKWIGTFRPPLDQIDKYTNYPDFYEHVYPDLKQKHLMSGQHDIPQYVTIAE